MKNEALFERVSPSKGKSKPSVNISHEKIGDLKAMWHEGKRLEVGKKWKDKVVSGFTAKSILVGKSAKGKRLEHVGPAGTPNAKAATKAKAFFAKIPGGTYELSIRVYVQFKDGSETEIVRHTNPMCGGEISKLLTKRAHDAKALNTGEHDVWE